MTRFGSKRFDRRGIVAGVLIGLMASVGIYLLYSKLNSTVSKLDLLITPSEIPADGVSSAELEIRLISRLGRGLDADALPRPPRVALIEGANLVKMVRITPLRYRLVAGFETGRVIAHVRVHGAIAPLQVTLDVVPSLADRNQNGYPDVLDLTSSSDRDRFRRWFTTIARGQLRHVDDRWHDRDCAGLLRYCYREALKVHDNRWLAGRRWLESAAIPDVGKYNYPNVPLVGTRIFNAGRRPDDATDATRGSPEPSMATLSQFHEFAEAARLKDNSLRFHTREVGEALPGDVIFYLNDSDAEWPYHTMIYLGNGQTVYHTGPDGDSPGTIKSLSLSELSTHPNPRWHPISENPHFLGFYRWRILAD